VGEGELLGVAVGERVEVMDDGIEAEFEGDCVNVTVGEGELENVPEGVADAVA